MMPSYPEYSHIILESREPSIQFDQDFVALCKSAETPKLPVEVGKVRCQALLDSGASVSLISENMSIKCSNPISRTQNARKLLTATGEEINIVEEVFLELSIGGLQCSHEFIVASPLVGDCTLGMDFWQNTEWILILS